jgi:hypothetical protein
MNILDEHRRWRTHKELIPHSLSAGYLEMPFRRIFSRSSDAARGEGTKQKMHLEVAVYVTYGSGTHLEQTGHAEADLRYEGEWIDAEPDEQQGQGSQDDAGRQ